MCQIWKQATEEEIHLLVETFLSGFVTNLTRQIRDVKVHWKGYKRRQFGVGKQLWRIPHARFESFRAHLESIRISQKSDQLGRLQKDAKKNV